MEPIYCSEDETYRIYDNICDKLCIERFYRNHSKSQTQLNNPEKYQLSRFYILFQTLLAI